MEHVLSRIGRASFRHRRLVVALWLVALAGLGLGVTVLGTSTSSGISIPGTESQRALDALKGQFPQASGVTGAIVVVAPPGTDITGPAARQVVSQVVKEAGGLPHVLAAIDQYTVSSSAQDMGGVLI